METGLIGICSCSWQIKFAVILREKKTTHNNQIQILTHNILYPNL